jgi:hypothetical protein
MDVQHGHAAWKSSMDAQYIQATWTIGHEAWISRMDTQDGDMTMQHGHGHVAFTLACSSDMDMKDGHVAVAWA